MKFLKDGNRVKVTVRFRGREMAHTSLGEVLLKQFGRELRRGRNGRKRSKARGTQYVHVPESQELKIIRKSKNRKENYYAQAEIP